MMRARMSDVTHTHESCHVFVARKCRIWKNRREKRKRARERARKREGRKGGGGRKGVSGRKRRSEVRKMLTGKGGKGMQEFSETFQ